MMSNAGLLVLLAGSNPHNFLLDVFDPLLPLVELAVLADHVRTAACRLLHRVRYHSNEVHVKSGTFVGAFLQIFF
jgi:hypothetical protein